MRKATTLIILLLLNGLLYAQDNEKFKLETVKKKCAALPLEQRARISVTRFTVTTATNDQATTQNVNQSNNLKILNLLKGNIASDAPTPTNMPPILGDNLTTMLTNALQEVSCYRVLESQFNKKDLAVEIDAGDSKYSNKKSAPKAGRQLGPQVVVTGEVIEYSVKEKGTKVLGVGSTKKVVKIGFNLKMINPETRDIIASHVFRVESKAEKSVSVLGLISTDQGDPAVAAVMEDGVLQAIDYMGRMRDSLNLTANGNFAGNGNSNGSKETEITLSNANFTSFTAFANLLSGLPGFQSMEKSLSVGTGSYTVTHSGKSDAFLEAINSKIGSKYEVTGFENGKIELKVK